MCRCRCTYQRMVGRVDACTALTAYFFGDRTGWVITHSVVVLMSEVGSTCSSSYQAVLPSHTRCRRIVLDASTSHRTPSNLWRQWWMLLNKRTQHGRQAFVAMLFSVPAAPFKSGFFQLIFVFCHAVISENTKMIQKSPGSNWRLLGCCELCLLLVAII